MIVNEKNASLKITAGRTDQFPRDKKPMIIFSGKSNVGKSSLINSLVMKKSFARVSSQPGKTITVNFYDIDGKVYFVDLPGYGFAKRSDSERRAFAELTDGFFTAGLPEKSKVVQLIDARTGPGADDATMFGYLIGKNIPCIIVLTKSDKLSPGALADTAEKIKESDIAKNASAVIPYSALKSTGRIELLKNIFSGL